MNPASVIERAKATPIRPTLALIAGAATALAIGVPTDIIANPVFGQEIPVRWWEYPVLVASALLVAAWFGIQGRPSETDGPLPVVSGCALALFAVGCPVCNKLVLAAVGASGALGLWAPLQPLLASISLLLLGAAVMYRWRRPDCDDDRATAL